MSEHGTECDVQEEVDAVVELLEDLQYRAHLHDGGLSDRDVVLVIDSQTVHVHDGCGHSEYDERDRH